MTNKIMSNEKYTRIHKLQGKNLEEIDDYYMKRFGTSLLAIAILVLGLMIALVLTVELADYAIEKKDCKWVLPVADELCEERGLNDSYRIKDHADKIRVYCDGGIIPISKGAST